MPTSPLRAPRLILLAFLAGLLSFAFSASTPLSFSERRSSSGAVADRSAGVLSLAVRAYAGIGGTGGGGVL